MGQAADEMLHKPKKSVSQWMREDVNTKPPQLTDEEKKEAERRRKGRETYIVGGARS
jgi:hypothetical protein